MRRDIEFTSGSDTVRGWLYLPDEGDGPFPVVVMAGGWCYVKELVQPTYARDVRRAGYRRRSSSTTATSATATARAASTSTRNCRSRTTATRSPSPRRSTTSMPSGSASGASPTAAATRWSSAPIDPRVKCVVSQIPVVDGYLNMRLATGRSASAGCEQALLDDRRHRFATGEDVHGPALHQGHRRRDLGVAVPRGRTTSSCTSSEHEAPNYDLERDAGVGGAADVLRRPAVRAAHLDTPTLMIVAENDDITLWDEEIERLQRHPDREEEAGRHPEVRPPGAVQQEDAAGAVRHRGDRMVRRAALSSCAARR